MEYEQAVLLMRRLEAFDEHTTALAEAFEQLPDGEERHNLLRALGELMCQLHDTLKRPILAQHPGIAYPDLDWFHEPRRKPNDGDGNAT